MYMTFFLIKHYAYYLEYFFLMAKKTFGFFSEMISFKTTGFFFKYKYQNQFPVTLKTKNIEGTFL